MKAKYLLERWENLGEGYKYYPRYRGSSLLKVLHLVVMYRFKSKNKLRVEVL